MKKTKARLKVSRETIRNLGARELRAGGGLPARPIDSGQGATCPEPEHTDGCTRTGPDPTSGTTLPTWTSATTGF